MQNIKIIYSFNEKYTRLVYHGKLKHNTFLTTWKFVSDSQYYSY